MTIKYEGVLKCHSKDSNIINLKISVLYNDWSFCEWNSAYVSKKTTSIKHFRLHMPRTIKSHRTKKNVACDAFNEYLYHLDLLGLCYAASKCPAYNNGSGLANTIKIWEEF